MTVLPRNKTRHVFLVVISALVIARVQAQNRGVYSLGMNATNPGVTPNAGFTYANQLLFYFRDEAKDDVGHTLPVSGQNYVLLDMNTLTWVSKKTFLNGANYSASVTLPIANKSLTSFTEGTTSGGIGFGDSYYVPFILGWKRERVAIRAMYGFLAPTGRFAAGASDNVGSGYWTHTLSSGQTFYITNDRRWSLSAFEMYEFHNTQEGTGIHPGDTFNLDYSLMRAVSPARNVHLQFGLVGYEQRQTTAKTGPTISAAASDERYAVNALGPAVHWTFPKHQASLGFRYFKEFANRSTFQGYSLQFAGSIHF